MFKVKSAATGSSLSQLMSQRLLQQSVQSTVTVFDKFHSVSHLDRLRATKVQAGQLRSYFSKIKDRKPQREPAEAAVARVKSGDTVYVHQGSSTPKYLLSALVCHGLRSKLENITIHTMLTFGAEEYCRPEYQSFLRPSVGFVGPDSRSAVNEGRADYIPMMLSELHLLYEREIVRPDVALIHLSPADVNGYHTLGPTMDAVRSALRHAKCIIALVNPKVPRTFGDTLIHESHLDVMVEHECDLLELTKQPETPEGVRAGKLIAENLVEDGSTLQVGIGTIPDAVLKFCANHRHLGIHTELISENMVDLIHSGAVSNQEKVTDIGKTCGTFAKGTKKLMNFIHNNPEVVIRDSAHTNDPTVIAQNPKVVAINTCLEIDIFGQSSSETIGAYQYSGFGGQIDFLRGAATAKDGKGKPILALTSTTKNGASKIVPHIKPLSSVVGTRAQAHYVVTEYGITNLFGKSLRQRAYAMIQLAHPDHRESLEKAAFERLKCMPSLD